MIASRSLAPSTPWANRPELIGNFCVADNLWVFDAQAEVGGTIFRWKRFGDDGKAK
jgi:hypothetical protein